MITAHDVEHAGFGRAQEGKSGYEEASVDTFLDRVVLTLEAIEQGKPMPAGALTSNDVVEAVFGEKDERTSGGYDLDDVDDLLDRVAQRLFEHEKQTAPAGQAAGTETLGDEPGDLVDNEPRREASRPTDSVSQAVEPVGGPVVVARNGRSLEEPEAVAPDRGVTTETASESGQGVAAEPLVEQYPATDHRVPLPTGDVSSQLSDEDRRAQNNYHPEYSEYDAVAAANNQAAAEPVVEQTATETPSGTDTEKPAPGTYAAAVQSSGGTTLAQTESAAETSGAPEKPSESVASVESTRSTESGDGGVKTAEPLHVAKEPATQPQAASTTTPVSRPEGIDRPEPIDRPSNLPKREEKSRKGLFRRLFRG